MSEGKRIQGKREALSEKGRKRKEEKLLKKLDDAVHQNAHHLDNTTRCGHHAEFKKKRSFGKLKSI